MGSEKFCLSWNDFESNISLSFRELREEKDFFDVTLSCGDEQIQAHKLILSACSPFFRSVLKKNVHQHPLLYLKGVKFSDLQAVLNFMYHGEVNVAQEDLNSFLAVAEDLKVKGLTQNNQSGGSKRPSTPAKPTPRPPPDRDPVPQQPKRVPRPLALPATHQDDEIQEVVPVKSEPRDLPPQAPPRQQHDLYSQDTQPTGSQEISPMDDSLVYPQDDSYEEFGGYEGDQGYEGGIVDSGLAQGQDPSKGRGVEITDGFWRYSSNGMDSGDPEIHSPDDLKKYILREPVTRLNVCGICSHFKHKVITNVREHIESKHYSHMFTYECKFCQKTFNTKMGLAKHKPKCSEAHKQDYYNLQY